MAGAIAQDTAEHLRAALDKVLRDSPEVPTTALAAFERLVEVLESGADAVVFAAEDTLSTQQAAALLGISRMTVVRLVERGELDAEGGAVHRRIAVSEVARYQSTARARRRSAIDQLADELHEDTPPDAVIKTR